MAAALLAEGRTTLTDVPRILDVDDHGRAAAPARLHGRLRRRGARRSSSTSRPSSGTRPTTTSYAASAPRSACSVRCSPACGRAEVALPGGDAIGSRPLDFHIAGLDRLGAQLDSEHGYIIARAPEGLTGATVWLDFPSVGATENVLMAAVLARGTTVIDNAAREPEIVDLVPDARSRWAPRSTAVGTSTLTIEGVDRLSPTEHEIVPDRIVAGTWAFAAAMTRGDVTVRNARAEHLEIALDKLVADRGDASRAPTTASGSSMDRRPRAVDVVTLPYPGLPTDLQPLVMALNAVADGAAMVTENIFEGAVHVRERAGPARRRRADRRPPRRRPRHAAALRCAGARQRHPGRCGARPSPALVRRRRDARQRHLPRRPRLPGLRRGSCARSGADVTREPDPDADRSAG